MAAASVREKWSNWSRCEDQSLMGDDGARQAVCDRAGTQPCRLLCHLIHEAVVMAGIVMEDRQGPDLCRIREAHGEAAAEFVRRALAGSGV